MEQTYKVFFTTEERASKRGEGKRDEEQKLKDEWVKEFVEERTNEDRYDELLKNFPERKVMGEEREDNTEEEEMLEGVEEEEEWKEKDEQRRRSKHDPDELRQMGQFRQKEHIHGWNVSYRRRQGG